jgi:Fe-S cluster assembly protein SufD
VKGSSLDFLTDRTLPGAAATWPHRKAALAELVAAGWPHRRQERWRYTDVAPLAEAGFDVAPSAPGTAELRAAAELLGPLDAGGARLVFVDGHHSPELSTACPEGIEVTDLDSEWREFDTLWAARVRAADHPLATLNTAFGQHGLLVRVRDGARIGAPLEIVFAGSSRPALAVQPRLLLDIGAGAHLTIVHRLVDSGRASGWLNAVTQLRQAAGSSVELYRLQQQHPETAHTSLLAAELRENAALRVGYVDLGGGLVRNDVDIVLEEPGASTELFGLFIPGASQHLDTHTTIVHAAPETSSDEAFRGIVGDRGRGVFNGKVVVKPKAQRIDARQSNDNLLLGAHAEIDTKPELEIYANDVKCSHGSTVGEIDGEQLFYLRTRGLAAADARRMLTVAFAATVLERIRTEPWRERILDLVTRRLRTLTERAT